MEEPSLDPMDVSARLSAQQFLLEQMYAMAFRDNRASFEAWIGLAIDRVRNRVTRTEPSMGGDDLLELQARMITYLQCFRAATAQRIEQGLRCGPVAMAVAEPEARGAL